VARCGSTERGRGIDEGLVVHTSSRGRHAQRPLRDVHLLNRVNLEVNMRWIGDLFAPYPCALCRTLLKPPNAPTCLRCGTRADPLPLSVRGALDARFAVFSHEGLARDAVVALKLGGECWRARGLGVLMAYACQSWLRDRPEVSPLVVPVPSTRARCMDRGGNPCAPLARVVGRELGVEVRFDALWRRGERTQRGRAGRARWDIEDAYASSGAIVAGRHVLVVDDVTTTGATFSACAKALVSMGAVEIAGVAVTGAAKDREEAVSLT